MGPATHLGRLGGNTVEPIDRCPRRGRFQKKAAAPIKLLTWERGGGGIFFWEGGGTDQTVNSSLWVLSFDWASDAWLDWNVAGPISKERRGALLQGRFQRNAVVPTQVVNATGPITKECLENRLVSCWSKHTNHVITCATKLSSTDSSHMR